MQTRVRDYEIVDHGIEHSHYFQGCGVAFTHYTNVVTGIGNDYGEALADVLDSLAQMGFDAEDLQERENLDTRPAVDLGSVPDDVDDMYYYVSIRWN